jgi:proteic killer suppression protein
MIRSFKHKGLKLLYTKNDPSKLTASLVGKIRVRLSALDNAKSLGDLALPSFDFHPLTGFNPKRYSIHVNGPFCMTFSFDTEPWAVDFENYH